MRHTLSIRAQVLLAVTGISVVTISGFAALVVDRVQARAYQLAHESAQENARLVAMLASRGLDETGASLKGVTRWLKAAQAWLSTSEDGGTRVQFFDTALQLRFDTSRNTRHTQVDESVTAALRGGETTEPVVLGGALVAASAPVRRGVVGGEVLGAVRVIKPALGVQEILASIAPEVGLMALFSVLLAVACAIGVGGSISRPIQRLTLAARRVAGGDRTCALPPPSGREVHELTAAYEEMRRELEDKHLMERMTQDLSHELKNPIAAIAALAETLESGGLTDPNLGSGLVAQIKRSAARLGGIVNDVLALSRLEARGVDASSTVVLQDLLAEAVADLQVRARERDVVVETMMERLPSLKGDPVWLRRALTNLISNAVENTSEGARVDVTARMVRGGIEIRVANPGEIPEMLRGKLFERFVSRRPDGTGLGLAIVRSVAEAHGGSVVVEEPGPPCVVLCLKLPVR